MNFADLIDKARNRSTTNSHLTVESVGVVGVLGSEAESSCSDFVFVGPNAKFTWDCNGLQHSTETSPAEAV